MATVWQDAAQAIFSALGLVVPPMQPSGQLPQYPIVSDNNDQGATSSVPLSSFGALTGAGDTSTLLTRFLQFGAFSSFIQFLGITEMIRWIWSSLYEYFIGQFVLRVHFDGDEMPYL